MKCACGIPIILTNSFVPRVSSIFINVYAITLFPFIFIKDEGDPVVINHESIHIKQQSELFVIFFYLLYVFLKFSESERGFYLMGMFLFLSPGTVLAFLSRIDISYKSIVSTYSDSRHDL